MTTRREQRLLDAIAIAVIVGSLMLALVLTALTVT